MNDLAPALPFQDVAGRRIAIIGAGPAGLMAAETLASAGLRVTLYDQMPSVGRKFLMAGFGGLNLTHGEPLESLLTRFRPAAPALLDAVRAFPPSALIAWCEGLGVSTFLGSSRRVFPKGLKASPLLRAWMARLSVLGVKLETRHSWRGWTEAGDLRFDDGATATRPDATILALGGASWPRLGSDGSWPATMPDLRVTPWAPANMGFVVAWSDHFRDRHEGTPLKRIGLRHGDVRVEGEALITRGGIEGGAIYALSGPIRDEIAQQGSATVMLDLRPDLAAVEVASRLASRPRAESLSNSLRKTLALPPVAIGLVQEALRSGNAATPVAGLVKFLPLRLVSPGPIARAISSAGGLAWSEVDERLMVKCRPGVFACGEMLDWEAPTGGYLLQGCFSTGFAAGRGALAWLREKSE